MATSPLTSGKKQDELWFDLKGIKEQGALGKMNKVCSYGVGLAADGDAKLLAS